MLNFLTHILQLIVNPAKGWEDVSHDNDDPFVLSRRGLYPLIFIGALSCFLTMLKIGHSVSFGEALAQAVVMVTVYFATLFLAGAAFTWLMPKISYKEFSHKRNATFIVYTLAILLLIDILINLVPIDFPVLNFLPIYVGVIIYKGLAYMGIKNDMVGQFMFLSVFSIMAPPYLLGFLFQMFL